MGRFRELDSLRFIFAMLVVLGHAAGWVNTVPKGWVAVDFFFILSGFVLSHAIISGKQSYRQFAIGRIARIFPLHWLTLLLFIAAFYLVGWEKALVWKDLGWNVFLLQSVGPKMFEFNWPSWSISVEFWINVAAFYFLVSIRARFLAIICCLALAPYWAGFLPNPLWLNIAMIRCIEGLCIGYLTYEAYVIWGVKELNPHLLNAVIFVEVVALCWLLSFFSDHWSNTAARLIVPCLILSLVSGSSAWRRLLQTSFLTTLGDCSFSIYLIHAPILCALRGFGFLGLEKETIFKGSILELLAFIATVIFCSYISYRYFEIPLKKMTFSFLIRRTQPTSIPA